MAGSEMKAVDWQLRAARQQQWSELGDKARTLGTVDCKARIGSLRRLFVHAEQTLRRAASAGTADRDGSPGD